MSLAELQDQRGRLVAQAREATDAINANTDEARAAELNTRADKFFAELDALDAKIEREERMARIEADFEQRSEARAKAEREARRPGGSGEARGADQGEVAEYRTVFHKMLQAGGDLSDLTGEERALLRSGVVEARALTAGTGSAGGYTVPTEMATFISEAMKLAGPMYDQDICTFIDTTDGRTITVPKLDDTSGTGYAHTEGAALTDDGSADPAFGQATLGAYVYDSKVIQVSFELLQDSAFNVESLLGRLVGKRLGRLANNKLTVGTGSSQPNGVVTGSSLGKTAASATAITFDEVIDLFHSVDPEYRASPKARFMMNDATLQTVRKLKDGQGNYLWSEGNVQGGIPSMIQGKPYSINQDMASIATGNKVMLFGDFSEFYVRRVGLPVLGVMRERFWPNVGLAGYVRFDSEIGQSGAIKHLINA